MVKSRLAASIGQDIALDLYMCFVTDMIEMLAGGGYPLAICFHPPGSRQRIARWLGGRHALFPQIGDDLGQRMKNAFERVFSRGFRTALLIGSDSPDLPSPIIDEALVSLAEHDAVVGPSFDGGYYLIGFRADTFLPQAFDGIPWSTPQVFLQTIEVLKKARLLVYTLPVWRDVDTFDDLKALVVQNPDTSFAESATMKYIRNNEWELPWVP